MLLKGTPKGSSWGSSAGLWLCRLVSPKCHCQPSWVGRELAVCHLFVSQVISCAQDVPAHRWDCHRVSPGRGNFLVPGFRVAVGIELAHLCAPRQFVSPSPSLCDFSTWEVPLFPLPLICCPCSSCGRGTWGAGTELAQPAAAPPPSSHTCSLPANEFH